MLKIFDRYILFRFFKSFFLISLIFFPMLFLADFFLQDVFSYSEAFNKIFFRYGQIFNMITILSVFMAIKNIRYEYGDEYFITIGFEKKDIYRSALAYFLILSSFYVFIIIPSNEYFFKQKLKQTNWGVKKINDCMFFVNKKKDTFELWKFDLDKKIYIHKAVLDKNKLIYVEKKRTRTIKFFEKDYYIIWNEPKKLSWKGLLNCKKYLKYHDLNYDDVTKQFHSFLSKIFLLLAMIICGVALAWKDSTLLFISCCILSNWIEQIAIFLPLFYSIFFSWANVVIWLIFGIWLLLK